MNTHAISSTLDHRNQQHQTDEALFYFHLSSSAVTSIEKKVGELGPLINHEDADATAKTFVGRALRDCGIIPCVPTPSDDDMLWMQRSTSIPPESNIS